VGREAWAAARVERALSEWNQMQLSFLFPSPEENLVDPVSKLPPVKSLPDPCF
jgi:hypothetical protein